jgi:RNA polymerase sigma-70 factor (ECF subfamily)
MDHNDDQQVVNRVLRGDVNAFASLVQRYQKPMYNLMFRVTRSEDEAAELTQEAFIRTYRNLERFQQGRRFFPWLYAIGLNIARDHVRKDKSYRELNVARDPEHLSGRSNPGEEQHRLGESLDFLRLEKALRELPLIYREAVVLRYHQELSMRDVARALSVSVSAAKMRVARGLEMLRQVLKGKGHDR